MDNVTVSGGTIDEVNSHKAMVLRPNTIMLFVYIALGLVGNAAIIYIYTFRFQQLSHDRFFIPYLAGIDAMACVICSSANIIINLNPVRYTDAIMCKSFFMLSQVGTTSSALMLTIIAVQRYQLICRPFKPKMTLRNKRLSVFFMLLFVFLASIPCLFTTGVVPIIHRRFNVTGYVCASIKVMGSNRFPFVYHLMVIAVFCGNLLVLSTLYVMIGKSIYGRVKNTKGVQTTPTCVLSSSDCLSEGCTGQTSVTSGTPSSGNSLKSFSEHAGKTRSCPIARTPSSAMSSVPQAKSSRNMKMASYRLSIMFLVITFVYVLCFVPILVAIVKRSLNRNVWRTTFEAETLGWRFASTFYIVNNIVNPIIYGFFDKALRRKISTWLSNIC